MFTVMQYLRWVSENGKRRRVFLSEKEIAEQELLLATRRLTRMMTPKEFYRPAHKSVKWAPPSPALYRGYITECHQCGRDCQGKLCRECWNKQCWQIYRIKRFADEERVALFKKHFTTVVQRKEMQMKAKQLPVTPITRSTSGLRTALFDEMEALRSGASNAQRARSIAMMANSILQSVQVEIEYHKYVKSNHSLVEGDKKVVALGTDISLAA